jgi:hypothetical protein
MSERLPPIDYSRYPKRQLHQYKPPWVFDATGWIITALIVLNTLLFVSNLVLLDLGDASGNLVIAWLAASLRWYQR